MKILLALSGGIDSMYLANRAASPDGPFASYPGPHEFAAAHCNFALRGEESDADETFVRSWCESHGMECFVIRFDTLAYAESKGISTEMAARELRYGWFAELVREHGFDALAIAHNANDNAETLFLNLLRGTGSRGLRGMADVAERLLAGDSVVETLSGTKPYGLDSEEKLSGPEAAVCSAENWGKAPQTAPTALPESISSAENWGKDLQTAPTALDESVFEYSYKILRPILKTERKEIERWMRENGKEWREDRTNAESVYKRNILRNEVFPILTRLNPSFVRTIGEDMDRFALVDDLAEEYYREKIGGIKKDGILYVNALLELKHWKYVLWRAVEGSGVSYPTFGKMVALLERYRVEPRGSVTICGKTFQTPSALISIVRIPKSGPAIKIQSETASQTE